MHLSAITENAIFSPQFSTSLSQSLSSLNGDQAELREETQLQIECKHLRLEIVLYRFALNFASLASTMGWLWAPRWRLWQRWKRAASHCASTCPSAPATRGWWDWRSSLKLSCKFLCWLLSALSAALWQRQAVPPMWAWSLAFSKW